MSQERPVILVVSQLPPPVHGSTVMTQRFMEGLSSAGYDTMIVERDFSRKIEDVGKYAISKMFKILALRQRLVKVLKEHRPDLCVFFTTVGLASFVIDSLLVSILKRHKIPFIHYFHGKGYRKLEMTPIPGIKSLMRYTLGGALGGLVLGKRLMADVDQFVSQECLYVLPNAVPDTAGKALRPAKSKNDKKTVVYLSNLIKTKGPKEVLQTASLVLKELKDVTFILAGGTRDVKFLEEIKDYIRIHGLNDKILVPGPLYGEEKMQLFMNADVFLFPTKYAKEAFPLVNLEAMQYSIPIISADEGAIPEAVRDGVNGYIVKATDIDQMAQLVIKLIRDEDLRMSMGRMGREIYEADYSIGAYKSNVKAAIEYFLRKIEKQILY